MLLELSISFAVFRGTTGGATSGSAGLTVSTGGIEVAATVGSSLDSGELGNS